MTQTKLKFMIKETHQLFKKLCCLPYHVFPVSIGVMDIYCTVAICNESPYFVIKLSHFVMTVTFCNETVAFCNKKLDTFCNKLLSDFVVK